METREGLASWGPLAGPWDRCGGNPIASPRGEERSTQNGPQTILRYRGRWVMLASSFIEGVGHVTIVLESDEGLAWRRMEPSYSILAP